MLEILFSQIGFECTLKPQSQLFHQVQNYSSMSLQTFHVFLRIHPDAASAPERAGEADFIGLPSSVWHRLEILICDLAAWAVSSASRRHEK